MGLFLFIDGPASVCGWVDFPMLWPHTPVQMKLKGVGLTFLLKHLINQADVQFCWEDEYTFRLNVLKSVSPSHVQNMVEKIILVSYSDKSNFVTR